jgi:excinuclease ABC subunit B
MPFKLVSPFKPTGDQPEAIRKLSHAIQQSQHAQTLLGVTGSGKTFTMANVIEQVQKPTLILSHNKTLVAQLYSEFSRFFPDNAVEYFVSYYDYYQPEAFIPSSGVYIEKDLNINEEIEKFRLKTASSLLSGRRDVIVVASVSCIYGAGNPKDYEGSIIRVSSGQSLSRQTFLHALVDSLYSRTTADFKRGNFKVKGEVVDVYPAYADYAIRFLFFGNEVEEIIKIDPTDGTSLETLDEVAIFPANIYVSPKEKLKDTIFQIQDDLVERIAFFQSQGRLIEAKRIEERVNFDLEMIRELGYCSGIENYSRYLDRRLPGERPFCLLDYFPNDFLLFVDESHVTVPQLHAMYGGDRSRKLNLVEYGFRLPAALDNRPLKFEEFVSIIPQVIYVSATPSAFEIRESEGVVVEQLIRPTGLLDPVIEVRPCLHQVDDLMNEIDNRIRMGDRILVTTLTKRMAEELTKFFRDRRIKAKYIHSEVKTLERIDILRELRLGTIDVLVGINLLREGLDLPEVSLVAIMDADKEGFLRSTTSLVQTIGRAARNANGKVIMYADKITGSMEQTIEETNRRRAVQMEYNTLHGITPKTVIHSTEDIKRQTSVADALIKEEDTYEHALEQSLFTAAEHESEYKSMESLQSLLKSTEKAMMKAAKNMDFLEAAALRDQMEKWKNQLQEMENKSES